ncbi:hypothetical protein A2389_01875 [Candidatus Adlerbacteria bacterium RIFOXYB1_FULL_48_10]|nr:MAG: hypothetical protein A2389_01875 [Candidatus Adlerbacteria bacterium RIFOXYB1_FULL_48_10]
MLRVVRWVPLVLCLLYILLVLVRIPAVAEKEKSGKAVIDIQAQHITVGDVLGNNLPPTPDEAQNSATLAGVDVNKNNIRDDIELSIFSATTNAQVRAAELQYVFAKQLALTSVFDSDTWVAFVVQENRGFQCLGQALLQAGVPKNNLISMVVKRTEELTALTLDTQLRKDAYERAERFATSYVLDGSHVCDVDLDMLQN